MLRPYQQQAVDKVIQHFCDNAGPCFGIAPTGAGKSHIIANIVAKLTEPVLILQPSKEILEQNFQKYINLGLNASLYSASVGVKEIGDIVFATPMSIKDYSAFSHIRYIVIDECEGLDPQKKSGVYNKIIDKIKPKGVFGVTATPWRLHTKVKTQPDDSKLIEGYVQLINNIPPFFWKKLIFNIDYSYLIENKYLAPIKYYFDVKGRKQHLVLNKPGTDYTEESINIDALKQIDRVISVLKHVFNESKKILIFMPTLDAAQQLNSRLFNEGFDCEIVSHETSKREREDILVRYRNQEFKILINRSVFLVGIDIPEIDTVFWNISTMNPKLYLQALGRGARYVENKVLSFYDFTNSVKRFGFVENLKIYWDKAKNQYNLFNTVTGKRITGKKMYQTYLNSDGRLIKQVIEPEEELFK